MLGAGVQPGAGKPLPGVDVEALVVAQVPAYRPRFVVGPPVVGVASNGYVLPTGEDAVNLGEQFPQRLGSARANEPAERGEALRGDVLGLVGGAHGVLLLSGAPMLAHSARHVGSPCLAGSVS